MSDHLHPVRAVRPTQTRRHVARLDCARAFGFLLLSALLVLPLFNASRAHAQSTFAATLGSPDTSTQAKGASASAQVSAKHILEAENQYVAGARSLDKGDPAKAEKDFANAVRLNPDKGSYAIALGIARQHRVNDLVKQAASAQRHGDAAHSIKLLEAARSIDPQNQMVQEHLAGTGPFASATAFAAGAAGTANPFPPQLSQQSVQIAPADPGADWSRATDEKTDNPLGEPPALASPIAVAANQTRQTFHFRSDVQDLLRRVYNAYGIAPVFSSTVQPQSLRIDLDDATWAQALEAAQLLSNTFFVPLTETKVLVLKESPENRQEYERLAAETVFLPALTPEQMSDMGNLVRIIFGANKTAVLTSAESLSIRAPAPTLRAINYMLNDLLDGGGEILLEMHMYEVDRSRTRDVGPNLPQGTSVFNYDTELASILAANQSLIDQLISQGATLPEAIAALIAAGACSTSPLCQPFATVGGGLTKTGVGVPGVSLSMALNSTSVRSVDDVQLRVTDHQTATFRNGTRYPIVTSTASYGGIAGSGTTSALLASLGLSQQQLSALGLGGANLSALQAAPYPQVQYQDLGLTLKATPVIQKSGTVSVHLEFQLQALTGASLDGNPVLSSRQFTSDVSVREGRSAILVSSVSKTESNALSGLPFLSELPGFFNAVTTNRNKEVDQQEIVIVLTPHIVRRRKDELASPMIALPGHAIPAAF